MAGPFRIDDELATLVEEAAKLQKRSFPKQIEHWVGLGRYLEQNADYASLVAIAKGDATVDVRPKQILPVSADEVFKTLEEDRANGKLAEGITRAKLVYEASIANPGYLDQIDEQGNRVTGSFIHGEFVAGTALSEQSMAEK